MEINEAIKGISGRDIFATQAMIVYNESGAALMMPVGASSDGEKYRIWKGIGSLEKAVVIAKDWGNRMSRIDFSYEEVEDIPNDPEVLLCNHFLLKFF